MTIQYHTLTDEQYKDQRYNVLVWLEESGVVKTTVYRDSKGFPTIGAGFKVTSNWDDILTAFGLDTSGGSSTAEKNYINRIKAKFYTDTEMTKEKTFTTAEIATLQSELNAIMAERASGDATKRTTFTFNDENEIKATFQVIAKKREDILDAWLAKKGIIVPYSNERVTLLSLVYNNIIGFKDSAQTILKSSKLLDALAAGNRAEAWYEIRYNSNGDKSNGIAKRRYYEADYFDLYNAEPQTAAEKELESKTILRMYTLHKDDIISYDNTYGAQVAKAKTDYNVDWVKTLTENLQSAKALLITNFAEGKTIDEVIVGKGLTTYEYKDQGNYTDNLTGTNNNDLIFGERGDDTIRGGKGNDILIGGEGVDTYYYKAGDGSDWINDTGTNNIIIEKADGTKQKITNFYETGDNIWTTPDGKIDITHHSPWQIVLEDGSTLTLGENLQDGDFGIHLEYFKNTLIKNNSMILRRAA